MGQMADCTLQRPSKEQRAAWRRDRVAARWAPLRHRCHAWRVVPEARRHIGGAASAATEITLDSSEHGLAARASASAVPGEATSSLPNPSLASGTTNESWAYRVCFASEATAWTSPPWAERLTFGWYNETLDEVHKNGSVTLHYRNGTGNRSAAVRCDCSSSGGLPEMVAWETRNGGLFHSLVFSLASCCLFKDGQGNRLPFEDAFARLTSPVQTAPCYTNKYGPWVFSLCFSNMTLSRLLGVAENNTATSSKQGELLLGFGTESGPRLVPARRVGHETFEDWGNDTAWEKEDAAVLAARLDAVLPASGSRRHHAAEFLLGRGGSCGTSFNSASVRWICPSSWRTVSPEMDGGHTALLAIERPSRCKWVAWVASMLVCAEERLLPQPSSPVQQISCRVQPKAHGEPLESSSSGGSDSDASSASGAEVAAQTSALRHSGTEAASRERQFYLAQLQRELLQNLGRPGGQFEIGHIVENLADGTLAVVVGWDGGPAMNGRPADEEANYLLLLAAGQLPAFGRLAAEIWGDRPGRAAVVPQTDLKLWRGGARRTSSSREASAAGAAAAAAPPPPIRLPRGAEGRLFHAYDYSLRRFTPTEELLGQHVASYRRQSGSGVYDVAVGASESRRGKSDIAAATSDATEDLDAMLSEVGQTVQTRRAKAAAQLAEGLSARRTELQEKLEALRNLQARMQSLQSMATALKEVAGGGGPSAEGSSLEQGG